MHKVQTRRQTKCFARSPLSLAWFSLSSLALTLGLSANTMECSFGVGLPHSFIDCKKGYDRALLKSTADVIAADNSASGRAERLLLPPPPSRPRERERLAGRSVGGGGPRACPRPRAVTSLYTIELSGRLQIQWRPRFAI